MWSDLCLEGGLCWIVKDVLEEVRTGGRDDNTAVIQAWDDAVQTKGTVVGKHKGQMGEILRGLSPKREKQWIYFA